MDNLPELRDIHLPTEGVSVFPLAAGWWSLSALLAAIFVAVKFIAWFRKTSKKIYARYLINKYAQDNSLNSAIKISEILRRICVSRYPEAVSLSGQAWIDFLNGKTPHKMSEKSANLLENAPYMPADKFENGDEVAALRRFCLEWIGANL